MKYRWQCLNNLMKFMDDSMDIGQVKIEHSKLSTTMDTYSHVTNKIITEKLINLPPS